MSEPFITIEDDPPAEDVRLRDAIGAKLLDRENLAAELSERNYSAESIGKILGGNMMPVDQKRASLPIRRSVLFIHGSVYEAVGLVQKIDR